MSVFDTATWLYHRNSDVHVYNTPIPRIEDAITRFHATGKIGDINGINDCTALSTHQHVRSNNGRSQNSPNPSKVTTSTKDFSSPYLIDFNWSPDGRMMLLSMSNNRVVVTGSNFHHHAYYDLLNAQNTNQVPGNSHVQQHTRHMGNTGYQKSMKHHELSRFNHSVYQQHELLRPTLAMTWLPKNHRIFLDSVSTSESSKGHQGLRSEHLLSASPPSLSFLSSSSSSSSDYSDEEETNQQEAHIASSSSHDIQENYYYVISEKDMPLRFFRACQSTLGTGAASSTAPLASISCRVHLDERQAPLSLSASTRTPTLIAGHNNAIQLYDLHTMQLVSQIHTDCDPSLGYTWYCEQYLPHHSGHMIMGSSARSSGGHNHTTSMSSNSNIVLPDNSAMSSDYDKAVHSHSHRLHYDTSHEFHYNNYKRIYTHRDLSRAKITRVDIRNTFASHDCIRGSRGNETSVQSSMDSRVSSSKIFTPEIYSSVVPNNSPSYGYGPRYDLYNAPCDAVGNARDAQTLATPGPDWKYDHRGYLISTHDDSNDDNSDDSDNDDDDEENSMRDRESRVDENDEISSEYYIQRAIRYDTYAKQGIKYIPKKQRQGYAGQISCISPSQPVLSYHHSVSSYLTPPRIALGANTHFNAPTPSTTPTTPVPAASDDSAQYSSSPHSCPDLYLCGSYGGYIRLYDFRVGRAILTMTPVIYNQHNIFGNTPFPSHLRHATATRQAVASQVGITGVQWCSIHSTIDENKILSSSNQQTFLQQSQSVSPHHKTTCAMDDGNEAVVTTMSPGTPSGTPQCTCLYHTIDPINGYTLEHTMFDHTFVCGFRHHNGLQLWDLRRPSCGVALLPRVVNGYQPIGFDVCPTGRYVLTPSLLPGLSHHHSAYSSSSSASASSGSRMTHSHLLLYDLCQPSGSPTISNRFDLSHEAHNNPANGLFHPSFTSCVHGVYDPHAGDIQYCPLSSDNHDDALVMTTTNMSIVHPIATISSPSLQQQQQQQQQRVGSLSLPYVNRSPLINNAKFHPSFSIPWLPLFASTSGQRGYNDEYEAIDSDNDDSDDGAYLHRDRYNHTRCDNSELLSFWCL